MFDNFRLSPRVRYTIVLLIVASSAMLYLWRSQTIQGLGFPLDDAWIHQTYARNLASTGEWAFIPGETSTGSTSPLWTLLLATGNLLSLPPLNYSYGLGLLILLATAWLAGNSLEITRPLPWLGLVTLILFEWHLVWAALSGMETLLLALHIVVILRSLEKDWHPALIGCIAGAGIWVRPDALLALLPIAWVIAVRHTSVRSSANDVLRIGLGFALFTFPYVLMNYRFGGEWWPSTFYAKQVEYAVTREAHLLSRLYKMGFAPLIGSGILLLPGIFIYIAHSVRSRAWSRLAGIVWIMAFISAYAVRLPVDYQHGRYMIPVIPALFLLGYRGLLIVLRQSSESVSQRILIRVWLIGLALITFLFWLRGAEAYATDVAVIESEMVAAAEWIATNTEPQDIIAAHDIGALGYFSDREILDLAGLISPEVIPIIRDEAGLAVFLDDQGANYLMTFPAWYPGLTRDRTVVFSTQGRISPSLGGENMTIYRWP